MMARAWVCSCFLALVACAPCGADVLDEIAPAAVVCIGNDAPAEERQAGRLIFTALRKRSDSALLLSDEQVLATPFAVSDKWHVIAVGRPTTNSVLFTYPSYWSLDRELYYAPLGNMPAAPFTETRGFYVGGFGYFFPGRNVGFVEFDRSPFYAAMLVSLANQDNVSTDDTPPLRFLIRITGSTPEGVLLGAKRFVESRMLYGLALGPPRWPRAHDIWNLDDENIKPGPPGWVPKGMFSTPGVAETRNLTQRRKDAKTERESPPITKTSAPLASSREKGEIKVKLGHAPSKVGDSLSFLGWLMADRTMYAGFLEITGCRPAQMWRAKYATEAGLDDFSRSPHHRASGNELLIVKLTSADELAKALRTLGGRIPVNISGRACYKTKGAYTSRKGGKFSIEKEGVKHVAVKAPSPTHILPATIAGEPFVILANFEKGYAGVIMGEVARSLPEKP